MHASRMGSAADPAITFTGVNKSFGRKLVLDHLDLTVRRGEVFALLGSNGARGW